MTQTQKALVIFGTRPEAIKLAPVIKELKQRGLSCTVCNTGQHDQLLAPILELFDIKPDFNLKVMKSNQSLSTLTSDLISLLDPILKSVSPSVTLVQGDTTSAMAGALVSFYHKVPVAHVEAGLRSGNLLSPFPEEANRKLIASLAAFHFTPTPQATLNLKSEGIAAGIYEVGNTVIDALQDCLKIIKSAAQEKDPFPFLDSSKKLILVTAHRRESFGKGIQNICLAIKSLAESRSDTQVVFSTHLNPNVQKPIFDLLSNVKGVHLLPPQGYQELVWLMQKSYLVLTDSGGLQEEAPSLGKPVLVLREVTERTEGIQAGTAFLVGTDSQKIVQQANLLLDDSSYYQRVAQTRNPYGDGKSSLRIANALAQKFLSPGN